MVHNFVNSRKTLLILIASSLLVLFLLRNSIDTNYWVDNLCQVNTNAENKPPDVDTITIQEMVSTLLQNDSRILKYIRDYHLFPPSTQPYNLTKPEIDDGMRAGLIPTLKNLLKNKVNGFFIEAGSNDGELVSSTLGFERFQSWSGLCVEPSPVMQPVWRSKQRKAWFADVCLSPQPFPMWTSFLHRDDQSIASKMGRPEDILKEQGAWTVYKVPCFPLFSLLSAMGVKEVDYFNLDVEGAELDVLRTIPFSEVLFRTISVELHPPQLRSNPPATKALVDFMTGQGFTTVLDRYPDYIFAHSSILKS